MKTIISLLLLTLSLSVNATDAKHHNGKALHDQKCSSCHSDSVYTREDKTVKTMSALEHQVNNCMKGAAKAEWTKPQTTSVVEFLNDKYYKF
jgi:cytochrome c553